MQRIVEREWLDELPPDDVQASQSRRDLRRLNFLMRHVGVLFSALANACWPHEVRYIVELGAGDGTFLLKLAKRLEALRLFAGAGKIANAPSEWWSGHTGLSSSPTRAVLVDRQKLVSVDTVKKFERLGWKADIVTADVFDWLAEARASAGTIMVSNLFLHHFDAEKLGLILFHISARSELFVACEPRRSDFVLSASRMLGLIGCNAVTRHDAVVSVQAGFVGRELSALWPTEKGWQLDERKAGLFSHCFVARRE